MTALLELGAEIGPSDHSTAAAARARPAAPGRLGELIAWLAATQSTLPPHRPNRVRCLLIGSVDDRVAALAADSDVGMRASDVPAVAAEALAAGISWVDDEVEAGADLLVLAAADPGLAAALLVTVYTGAEPVSLLPRGAAAIDTGAWVRQAVAVRDARRHVADLRNRPDELLAALDSPSIAAAVGVVLQSAARRTPIILDGTAAVAAALLCLDLQTHAADWWQVADSSDDVVHCRAVAALDRRPLLDLGAASGAGLAGILAVAVLRAAVGSPLMSRASEARAGQ